MVDIEKTQRFRLRFRAWRGPELAAKEEHYLAAALSISDYVDTADLAIIQRDLVLNSDTYRGFNNKSYGAALFGKLAIQDYYEQCTQVEERNALFNLLSTFDNLYSNTSDKPSEKFNLLMTYAHQWLDELETDNHENIELTKKTCLSLHVMLTFFDIKLKNLTRFEGWGLSARSIDYQAMSVSTQALLNKTTEKIITLNQHDLPPAIEIETEEKEDLPETMDKHINSQCLEILNRDISTLNAQIEVVELLTSINEDLERLIAEDHVKCAIENQIDLAQTFLMAIQINEEKSINKQSAKGLIEAHQKSYEDLIANAPADVQAEWNLRKEQLNTYGAQIDAQASYVTSLLSPFIPQLLSAYLPTSYDTETREMLKNLVGNHLKNLNAQLRSATEKKIETATRLANGSEAVINDLLRSTTPDLETLMSNNQKINQIMADYQELSALMIENQDKLHKAKDLGVTIESFIENHHNFFVKLSLFLSKISILFKTDAAKKVEKIHEIKDELGELKANYEQTITQQMNTLRRAEEHPLKDVILGKLALSQDNEPNPLRREGHSKNLLTAFNHVGTLFNELKAAGTGSPDAAQHNQGAVSP